jgi:ubiquinone/menaquinone biosynthesis C-methylase UbiE
MWWQNWHQLPQDMWLLLSDLSAAMVVAARDRAPRYPERPRVAYQIGEGEALPLAGSQFDVVVALGVLDHMAEPEKCLAQVQRVLRPGGRFFASAGGRRHLQELSALVQPFLPEETYGGDPQRFGLHNGEEILRPWFAPVARLPYEDDLVFEEVDPIVDYVRSEGNVAEKLGRLKLAGFVEHVKKRLAEEGEIRITREKGLFVGEL